MAITFSNVLALSTLCLAQSAHAYTNYNTGRNTHRIRNIIIGCVIAGVVVLLLPILFCCMLARRRRARNAHVAGGPGMATAGRPGFMGMGGGMFGGNKQQNNYNQGAPAGQGYGAQPGYDGQQQQTYAPPQGPPPGAAGGYNAGAPTAPPAAHMQQGGPGGFKV